MKHSALDPSVHHKQLVLKPLLYPLSYGAGVVTVAEGSRRPDRAESYSATKRATAAY
jgi:hypothetical protein